VELADDQVSVMTINTQSRSRFTAALLGALCSAGCSEASGPAPEAGYSTARADYSTPEDRIAQTIHLPAIDLNVPPSATPIPMGNFTCQAGTRVRLVGHLIRQRDQMHFPPRLEMRPAGPPGARPVQSAIATWGEFDRPSLRHDYVIEIAMPPRPGSYVASFTTTHVSLPDGKRTKVELGTIGLEVRPASPAP